MATATKRVRTEFKLTTADAACREDTQETMFRSFADAQAAAACYLADPGCGSVPLSISKCDNRNGYWSDVETLAQF